MDLLARLVTGGNNGTKPRGSAIVAKSSDDFFALYPNLYRLMTEENIGGVDRALSKLSIKMTDQGFCATLTEPASGQVIFHIGDNLFRLVEALEQRLVSDNPGWQPDKYADQRKKKK